MKEECIFVSDVDASGQVEDLEKLEELEGMHVVVASLANLRSEDSSRFGKGVYLASAIGHPDRNTLTKFMEVLKSGAQLSIRLPEGAISVVRSECLLTGFKILNSEDPVRLLVEKPAWKLGSKSSISLKSSLRSKQSSGNVDSSVASAWKVMADDDDLDLIDDDDLLTEEDLKIVESGDCARPAKKACKDCTCGRAEAEAKGVKVQLTQDMLDNPQSACGSVSVG